jgi:hypothetical protein
MKLSRLFLVLLIAGIAPAAVAAVSAEDLPSGTIWYMHADLQQMRSTESGSPIYNWFDDEVVVEINAEFGISLDDEVDSVTAFSDTNTGTVIVVDGPLSKKFRSELLGKIRREAEVREFAYDGNDYFHANDDDDYGDGDDEEVDGDSDDDRGHKRSEPFDDLDDGVYFSFAVGKKLIVTSREEQMKALLDSKGKITGNGSVEGAMFVLTADKNFVQAGLRPEGMSDDDDTGWESNIIRNTEQAALLISDSGGLIAVEAQLLSADANIANSLAGIVSGLIALQAFNTELDPDLLNLIQNTKVSVSEKLLSISTVIDPEFVVTILED